ncbi:MAPEG family protein [uncultured Enterovirga sp.]|uniref:MAPEG family protein n=1 Tax=uncultured Enterovirga sp. TaxID=2026352 RepID=UPI0035C97F3F
MTIQSILLPVFVQVLLVFAIAVVMGQRRYEAVKANAVRYDDVILGQKSWPGPAQAASNAFSNQFELPVLFFAIVPLAIVTRKADLLFVVLSWVFVLSRILHAGVYVTTNALPYRFGAFAVGALALLVMWIVFAVRILAAPMAI